MNLDRFVKFSAILWSIIESLHGSERVLNIVVEASVLCYFVSFINQFIEYF